MPIFSPDQSYSKSGSKNDHLILEVPFFGTSKNDHLIFRGRSNFDMICQDLARTGSIHGGVRPYLALVLSRSGQDRSGAGHSEIKMSVEK